VLACFPDPYPDELFYSICARFRERVQYPNKKNTVRELFGSISAIAVVDLPSNLQNLVAGLLPGSSHTADELINQHTLLPFLAPFLPLERVQQLRADMAGNRGQAIYTRAGLMASTIQSPQWLRFCPVCVQDERQRYGEAYWHRLHQLPGVEVCPDHQVYLLQSKTRVQNPTTRHLFIAADQAIQSVNLRSLAPASPHHKILLKIDQDAAWLLNYYSSGSDLKSLRNRYLDLLADRDLATYNGRVRVGALLKEFCCYYPPDLLNRLQCRVDAQSQHNWLFRLVRSPKSAQHPLYHLLLTQFLGHSVGSFLRLPNQFRLFGQSPWPCLNPVAGHFQQPMIQDCRISYTQDHGKPVGTFYCICGFVYCRTGPDESADDRFRITKI
jgi:hypothetical protein